MNKLKTAILNLQVAIGSINESIDQFDKQSIAEMTTDPDLVRIIEETIDVLTPMTETLEECKIRLDLVEELSA